MAESQEQQRPRWHDLDTPLILTIGIVSAILIFGVIVPGVKALVYNATNQRMAETMGDVHPDLRAYQTDENAILHGQAAWVNKQQGVTRIDIDTAIELYAERAEQR